MSDIGNELSAAFETILADRCDADAVRAVERNADGAGLWAILEESGFLDALVPEAAGGAGLAWCDVVPLIELAGRYALPLPFAETMVARALLAGAGIDRPAGPILLAVADGRDMRTAPATFARVSAHALVARSGAVHLLPVDRARIEPIGTAYDLAGRLSWPSEGDAVPVTGDMPALGAAITAALIAGGLRGLLDMTIGYAGDRKQFGRPIGKFQAVQQQISVMAEHVAAATLAARLAFAGDAMPAGLPAAVAKMTASEAVRIAVPIAHAVHAAIGISAEHPLHLHTRRLNLWRMEFGAEHHWSLILGQARLAHGQDTIGFLRSVAAC